MLLPWFCSVSLKIVGFYLRKFVCYYDGVGEVFFFLVLSLRLMGEVGSVYISVYIPIPKKAEA